MPGDAWTTLTVVGSGTLLPSPQRGSASFHVQVGGGPRQASLAGGHSLLLDAGAGTLHGLPRAGVDWRAIDTVAVSHFHPDHVSDVPALLAAYRYEGLTDPLTVVGPAGVRSLLERMASVHGRWVLEPSRPLSVEELSPGQAWTSADGLIRIHAHDTPHTAESVAYRVAARPGLSEHSARGTATIGYTGDTGPSDTLPAFLAGCDVLVAECSLTDPPSMETHLSPAGLARFAAEAAPELLLVSHVYPPQTPDEAVEAIRTSYAGRVEAARDGDAIHVGPSGVTLARGTVDPPPDAV